MRKISTRNVVLTKELEKMVLEDKLLRIHCSKSLAKFAKGDWGEVEPGIKKINDNGLNLGAVITGRYPCAKGVINILAKGERLELSFSEK